MRFNLFFQTHWQNICTFSALLSGWFYYIYFEINSYNRSSWSKQIFAVALCLYKLRCSSNTSKWSLSCCPFPEDQEIDKKHCISDAQGDPYSSTAPTFPRHAFCWGSSNRNRPKSKAELPHRYLPELPSTTSSFPSLACADNERTLLQLVPTLWCRISSENPEDKPFHKTKVHTTKCLIQLRCKELERWFISTRIEKCLLGKESSGGRDHCSPTAWLCPRFLFRDHLRQHLLMDLYSWVPSSWGTLTPTAMLKQNMGARLPRWAPGRQAVHLWEAISTTTIWNQNALGAVGRPHRAAIYTSLLVCNDLPGALLSSTDTCASSWVLFSNSCWKATVQTLLNLGNTSDQNSPLISGCLQATTEQFLLTLFPSV